MREIPPGLKKPADAAAMRAYLVAALAAIVVAVAIYIAVTVLGRHTAGVAGAARAVPAVALMALEGRA